MRRFITTCVSGIFTAALLCLVFTAPAAAKINAEIRADEAGLYVNYDLWVLGKSQATLTPGSQPLAIPVLGLATIELSVLDVQADTGIIMIHAKVSTPAIGPEPVEADLPVPFGDYGIYYSLFERRFIPIGDHKIELSALLTRLSTQYDVNISLEPIFSGHWLGTKNPEDNIIHETIENPLDGTTTDITIELEYKCAYITNMTLTIGGLPGNPVTPLQIPVPNGTFHLWADFELPEGL